VAHISTGDAFRAAVQAGSPVGVEAKGYLDRGELVPDPVTIGVLRERLTALPPGAAGRPGGFILDGFPRNLNQARALDDLLGEDGLDVAVNLDAPVDEVLKRISARRVCTRCGTVYNLVDHPPAVPGVCDACGGEVTQREDDTEAAIRRRLEIYETDTAPVLQFYRDRGLLATVDALGPPDEVAARFTAAVHAALRRRSDRPPPPGVGTTGG
jgi:adenylate kinase